MSKTRIAARFALFLLFAPAANAAPSYPWLDSPPSGDDLEKRFPAPPGSTRATVNPGSFGEWLRHLPLLPPGTPVLLFDKSPKSRQDVHAAVVDLDVGTRDLQQCADAVMRLRAEYLYSRNKTVGFHPDPGKPRQLLFAGRDRAKFKKYLTRVFADAGSASLQAELSKLSPNNAPLRPGDVLIQGGYPGHAVIVLDVAEGAGGKQWILLGQSYMPAQQFHVLKNPRNEALSPWYDTADLAGGLQTPEWRPFSRGDVRRFPAGGE